MKATVFSVIILAAAALRADDYMVVDISGGTNAPSFAVSYMKAVPQGGWGDLYKTDRLVLRKITGCPGSKDYWIGVFEMTQRQYELTFGPNDQSCFKGAKRPADGISWYMARTALANLSARTGMRFWFPTEAQWEYAARAGESAEAPLDQVARHYYNQHDGKGGTGFATAEVGSYAPNAWGLYDMRGNVWEWTDSWFIDKYLRLYKGGSWSFSRKSCSIAYRTGNHPGVQDTDVGFRACAFEK